MRFKNNGASPYGIQWTEGMMLTPQHMQQNDRLQRTLLTYRMGLATPSFWGLVHLVLDEGALLDGTVRVLELEVVFEDGTCFLYPNESDETSLELQLIKDLEATQPKIVFLCFPSIAQTALDAYRSVEDSNVEDENTQSHPVHLTRLKPKVFLSAEKPLQCWTVPLLEMAVAGGSFSKTDFIPTRVVFFQTAEVVQKGLALVKRMKEKIMYLRDHDADQRSLILGIDGAQLTEAEYAWHSLLRAVMPLETLLRTVDGVAPFFLFYELCRIAGELAWVGSNRQIPTLEGYKHSDQSACFERLFTFIFKTVDAVANQNTFTAFRQNGRLFSIVPTTKTENDYVVGVRTPVGSTFEDLRFWIEGAIIASESQLLTVETRRTLGAKRTIHNALPEFNLVAGRNTVLVKIPISDPNIDLKTPLCFINPSDTDDARPDRIMLYVGT